jgi:hypothetical protein
VSIIFLYKAYNKAYDEEMFASAITLALKAVVSAVVRNVLHDV